MTATASISKRNRPARLVDGILILVVLLVAWLVFREVFHIGGLERGLDEASHQVAFVITASELAQGDWRVGTVVLNGSGTVYEASMVNQGGQELFKLRMNASTGKLLGTGEKPPTQGATALPAGEVKRSLETLLGDLTPGRSRQKGKEPFFDVPLIYQGSEVASLKVDPASRKVIPKGQRVAGDQKGEEKEGKGKIIPKNLIEPLGWGSALIMIVSSLYYSWKRSLYSPLRAASGEAKARVIAGLRRTLWWHMAFGTLAVAIAILHVLNFTAKIQLSVSWLTLAMALTVALSGAFGRFVARSEAMRRNWRRFHVPYTILFFVVLFIHILERTGVLRD
ncbi:MAG: hypothetical protein HYY02_00980 [Chloroflexi bacterium]|nr:hypothetical protein [Chloroflexota bacterium]